MRNPVFHACHAGHQGYKGMYNGWQNYGGYWVTLLLCLLKNDGSVEVFDWFSANIHTLPQILRRKSNATVIFEQEMMPAGKMGSAQGDSAGTYVQFIHVLSFCRPPETFRCISGTSGKNGQLNRIPSAGQYP